MKFNKTNVLKGVLAIFIVVLFSNSAINSEKNNIIEQNTTLDDNSSKIPIASADWENTSISIDATMQTNTTHSGNWTWALNQEWCSGDGTEINPFLIQSIAFNIPSGMKGLEILNSKGYNFTVKDCTFVSPDTTGTGLYLSETSNGTILNCQFQSNAYGINLANHCDYNNISNNFVNDSSRSGIYLRVGSNYNQIQNNQVNITYYTSAARDSSGMGILLWFDCNYNVIVNNTCKLNDKYGIRLQVRCIGNKIQKNTVENNRNGITARDDCDYNLFDNNTIRNNGVGPIPNGSGLEIVFCTLNNITNNIVTGNGYAGIRITESSHNIIFNNTANQNSLQTVGYAGIQLYNSKFNNISENNLDSNNGYGIFLRYNSNNNSVFENMISLSNNGIRLEKSCNNSITENKLSNIGTYVFFLTSSSNENYLQFNNCTTSINGIYLSSSKENIFQDIQILGISQKGIRLTGASIANRFINVEITGITSHGVECESGADQNYFSHITLEGGGFAIFGPDQITIENNCTVNGEPVLIFNNTSNLSVDGDVITEAAQIFVMNSKDIIIKNFVFTNSSSGIYAVNCSSLEIAENRLLSLSGNAISIYNSNFTTIRDNIVNECDNTGLVISNCNYTNILRNEFINCSNGLRYVGNSDLYFDPAEDPTVDLSLYSGYLHIMENTICGNEYNGISLSFVVFADCRDNLVENNGEIGISLDEVYNSSISGNRIVGNLESGLYLSTAYNNSISQNLIVGSDIGCDIIDYVNQTMISRNEFRNNTLGLSFNGDDYLGGNIITRNKFINNSIHAYDEGILNLWHYEGVGNYWENYTASDVDSNGLGDIPYEWIEGNANSTDLSPILVLVPVFIVTPADLSIDSSNGSFSINWTARDYTTNNSIYSIFLNGELIDSDNWISNNPILLDLTDLVFASGTNNITIVLDDGETNTIQNSVFLVYTPPEGGDGLEPDSSSKWWINLIVFGVIAVVVVGGVSYFQKKHPEKVEPSKKENI